MRCEKEPQESEHYRLSLDPEDEIVFEPWLRLNNPRRWDRDVADAVRAVYRAGGSKVLTKEQVSSLEALFLSDEQRSSLKACVYAIEKAAALSIPGDLLWFSFHAHNKTIGTWHKWLV